LDRLHIKILLAIVQHKKSKIRDGQLGNLFHKYNIFLFTEGHNRKQLIPNIGKREEPREHKHNQSIQPRPLEANYRNKAQSAKYFNGLSSSLS